jgi:hypothetical protein
MLLQQRKPVKKIFEFGQMGVISHFWDRPVPILSDVRFSYMH